MLDMDHRCTEQECPHIGQRSDRGCGCHKTREQMLEDEVVRLRRFVGDHDPEPVR